MKARALLIYDGLCPYCRIWRGTVDFFDFKNRIAYLPFYATPAQRLLKAQFGPHKGFTIFAIDAEKGRVYWDRHAASRVAEYLRVPFPGSLLAGLVYPAAAWAITRAIGRWHRPHMPFAKKLDVDEKGRVYAKLRPAARKQLGKILKPSAPVRVVRARAKRPAQKSAKKGARKTR